MLKLPLNPGCHSRTSEGRARPSYPRLVSEVGTLERRDGRHVSRRAPRREPEGVAIATPKVPQLGPPPEPRRDPPHRPRPAPNRTPDRPGRRPRRRPPLPSTTGLSVFRPVARSPRHSALAAACTVAATCHKADRSGLPRRRHFGYRNRSNSEPLPADPEQDATIPTPKITSMGNPGSGNFQKGGPNPHHEWPSGMKKGRWWAVKDSNLRPGWQYCHPRCKWNCLFSDS